MQKYLCIVLFINKTSLTFTPMTMTFWDNKTKEMLRDEFKYRRFTRFHNLIRDFVIAKYLIIFNMFKKHLNQLSIKKANALKFK